MSRQLLLHSTLYSNPAHLFHSRSSPDGQSSDSLEAFQSSTHRQRWLYALIGVFLALGAPAGALLLRMFSGLASLRAELVSNAFFYLYMLVGTAVVFGAAGFVAGLRADMLAQERDRFVEISEHDELTGLLNSRAFWGRYRRALEKAGRYGEPLSLLIIDLDHLKDINDQEGHQFGNKALQHVAEQIQKAKRTDDVSARWGGDEFVVLMPGADVNAATRVAETIRAGVSAAPVTTTRTERMISTTIGIASAEGRQQADGLFDRADRALFRAKRQGGNRYEAESSGI